MRGPSPRVIGQGEYCAFPGECLGGVIRGIGEGLPLSCCWAMNEPLMGELTGVELDYGVDIRESELLRQSPGVLALLLKDHTTQRNIFWATDSYAVLGQGYQYADPITAECITGEHGMVIRPRALKHQQEQEERTRGMAEVFTPAWLCNRQNNLIDEAWFGRPNVFNEELPGGEDWRVVEAPVQFPKGKGWRDYLREVRLEITCGEAPYLASRYDATTGQLIPLERRVGMLDRKLRVLSENTATPGEWLKGAQLAFRSLYGFEWQGDNLLLAREAMVVSFAEYYMAKFGRPPLERSLRFIAYIVSWNLWQMDGLKGVIPGSCRHNELVREQGLFGARERRLLCPGCEQGDLKHHNGTYCLLRDWGVRDPITGRNHRKIRFIDLVK